MSSNTQNLNYGATITRLSLGVILLAHGLLKVFVGTIPGTVGWFESLGFPAIIAYLVMFGEIAGGAALIAGLYTRLVAILSVPILLGATWYHFGNGWLFSFQGGGWEFPALLVVMAVTVALQGSGAFALKKLPVIDRFIPQVFKA